MNKWLMLGIVIGAIAILAVTAINVTTVQAETPQSTDAQETIDCSNCGNSCNAQRNCGLATCGAVSGNGGCGCGR